MQFNFTADQLEIRDSLERVFADLCSDDILKSLATNEQGKVDMPLNKALWDQLAENGVFSLPFSTADDGLGLSLVELCLILELQGKHVAPLPIVSSVIECAMTISDSANTRLKQNILPGVMNGETILAPVRAYQGIQAKRELSVVSDDSGWALDGDSGFVAYASDADGFVVSVRDESGKALLLYCESGVDGLQLNAQKAITDEPAGLLSFTRVRISKEACLAEGEAAEQLLELQRSRAQIALAAIQVGALEEGLKRTAEYVSQRKQFGRVLGSFQAVSQQAANAYMEIESLRSVYWRALDNIESGEDFSMAAKVVKYWVAQAGHAASHTILHLHGGIGQDLDYPIHRYFLLAKQCERYLGSADEMTLEVGRALFAAEQDSLEALCV